MTLTCMNVILGGFTDQEKNAIKKCDHDQSKILAYFWQKSGLYCIIICMQLDLIEKGVDTMC